MKLSTRRKLVQLHPITGDRVVELFTMPDGRLHERALDTFLDRTKAGYEAAKAAKGKEWFSSAVARQLTLRERLSFSRTMLRAYAAGFLASIDEELESGKIDKAKVLKRFGSDFAPPLNAKTVLLALMPRDIGEASAGDLEQMFQENCASVGEARARWIYRAQVARSVPPVAWKWGWRAVVVWLRSLGL